jgi:hypothetical protein
MQKAFHIDGYKSADEISGLTFRSRPFVLKKFRQESPVSFNEMSARTG